MFQIHEKYIDFKIHNDMYEIDINDKHDNERSPLISISRLTVIGTGNIYGASSSHSDEQQLMSTTTRCTECILEYMRITMKENRCIFRHTICIKINKKYSNKTMCFSHVRLMYYFSCILNSPKRLSLNKNTWEIHWLLIMKTS